VCVYMYVRKYVRT